MKHERFYACLCVAVIAILFGFVAAMSKIASDSNLETQRLLAGKCGGYNAPAE